MNSEDFREEEAISLIYHDLLNYAIASPLRRLAMTGLVDR